MRLFYGQETFSYQRKFRNFSSNFEKGDHRSNKILIGRGFKEEMNVDIKKQERRYIVAIWKKRS